MAEQGPLSTERILLVEGHDDKHVVRHICQRRQYSPPHIEDKDGIDRLLDSISPELKVSGRQAVGILLDANDDPEARWTSIRARLSKVGVTLPEVPDLHGTIVDTGDLPRVGIWLMPDNESQGALEHFIEKMIPSDDAVWPLSRQYIEGIPEEHRRFKESHSQKAKIHAWLATRETPGLLMGTAISSEDLQLDGDLVEKFVAWLQELFGLT